MRFDMSFVAVVLCATTGCMAQASLGPGGAPPPPPPPPAGGGEVIVGQVIEAGCSFNATQIQREMGDTVQIRCPSNCGGTGSIWGTDVYTADSAICHAAIHAGAASPGGGLVTVHLEPGRPAYRGSDRNGMQSSDYPSYGASYRFVGAAIAEAPPPAGSPGPAAIEAGCSFNATELHGAPGSAHRIACPSGCGHSGATWGTDVYTADSAICRAAIHAGVASEQGGEVTVILEPGRPAYRGSRRHGIESSDYGNYGASYRFAQ